MNDSASRLAESYITQALEAVSQQDTARATQLVDRALLAQPTNQEALNLRAQLTGTAPSAARPISAPTAASPPSAYYGAPAGAPTQGGGTMSLPKAISTCFSKYADFSGRASRAEFWWWALFFVIAYLVSVFIDPVVSLIVILGLVLPTLAVSIRRLHDSDRSGWWYLLNFVPFGGLVLLLFYLESGSPYGNSYGPKS